MLMVQEMLDEILLEDWMEEEAADELNALRRRIRNRQLALDLSDKRFTELFRITKSMFEEIMNLVESDIPVPLRRSSYPKATQVLVVLRFLAIGDYQRPVGEDLLLGVCQSGVSNILEKLLPILERRLGSKYIKWPTTREERQISKEGFYEKYGIPSTIGVIDGTQIGITSPTQEHLYLNRKGFHSINTSLICDHEQKFIYVDARHPGATHDAAIWALSEERKFLFNINRTQHERCWILGDSGYPLEPWLITPYRNARTDEQIRFNNNFSKIRTIIENSIGVLKNRWRILLTSERTLRYKPIKMSRIINCCVALHNFCKLENIPDVEGDFAISYEEEDDIFQEYGHSTLREEGEYNRELLKRYIM